MPLNKPTTFDGTAINGATGIEVWIGRGEPYSMEETIRRREGSTSVYEGGSPNPRRKPLTVLRTNADMPLAEFDSYVWGLFQPSSRTRVIVAERDGVTYSITARVSLFDRSQQQGWTGEILLLDPVWSGPSIGPITTSPLDVTGNTDTQPIIRITDGAAALRRRLTLRDQSGHGFASWPNGVDVSADLLDSDNYIVYQNGVPSPHWVESGSIYFRSAAKANDPTFIDIISSAEISNTENDLSGQSTGGLEHDSGIAAGSATVDPSNPWSNARAFALSWHPGVAGEHSDNRTYTYGFDGDGALRLIDSEHTGRSWRLKNDADAYILTSPVEMTTLSDLSIEAFVGFQSGRGSSKSGSRVLKVTIQDANGNISNGPVEDSAYVLALRDIAGTERNPNYSYYATFNMGGINFPDTTVAKELTDVENPGTNTYYSGTTYRNDYLPTEFGALAAKYLGCPVTSGGSGVWYLWFDEDAYGGLTIPFPSMSIQAKAGRFVGKTIISPPAIFLEMQYGHTAIDNVLIMNSEWVDPVTKESLGTGADTTPGQDFYGVGKIMVWYWTRDSELPKIAFERTIVGYAAAGDASAQPNTVISAGTGGLVYTITPPPISIPGAVKVAVGIAQVASAPDNLDWIAASITQPTIITLDATQLPAQSQVDVQGQILNGSLRNLATGETIGLSDVYSDENGLELDCRQRTIQGVGGAGMVYGEISPSGGLHWLDLPVGAVTWDAIGDLSTATIAFTFEPQLIGNS